MHDEFGRIRVAAVAAATSVARVPSGRKLAGQKPVVTQNQVYGFYLSKF